MYNTIRHARIRSLLNRAQMHWCWAAGLLLLVGACGNGTRSVDGAFTIVVLPDTQVYAMAFPDLFHAQTRWIRDHVEDLNIQYVFHLGDIVQLNAHDEWSVARDAFERLDGEVPYALAIGNHDMGPGGMADTRQSLVNQYFPLSGFESWPTFGGVYDKEPDEIENSYHLFSAGGRDWLVLALEFGPRDDVLRWANDTVAAYPCRSVILVTHAYLDARGERYIQPPKTEDFYPIFHDGAGFNDGQDIWRRLVSRYPNFVMVINGHFPQPPRHRRSKGKGGTVVHQMMVDYQDTPNGGNGLLRLLRFLPDSNTVVVEDFSPVSDETSEQLGRRFELEIAPPPMESACSPGSAGP